METWIRFVTVKARQKVASNEKLRNRLQPSEGPLAALGWIVTTLTAQYSVGSVLGEGGSGTVFRGHRTDTPGDDVVLKLQKLRPDSLRQEIGGFEYEVIMTQFVAAAEAGGADSGQVCPRDLVCEDDYGITEIGEDVYGIHVYQQEGLSLDKAMAETAQSPPPMAVRAAIGQNIVRMVDSMHAVGVAHMDIKPHNVLVVNGSLRLIDFSMAVALENVDDALMAQTVARVRATIDASIQTLLADDALVNRDGLGLAVMGRLIIPTVPENVRVINRKSGTPVYMLYAKDAKMVSDAEFAVARDRFALGLTLLEVYHWDRFLSRLTVKDHRQDVVTEKLEQVDDPTVKAFIGNLLNPLSARS